MSAGSPYILPKRSNNQQQSRGRIIAGGRTTLPVLPLQPRIARTISLNRSPTQRPQPRVLGRIIDPMPLGQTRRLYLAPATAVMSSSPAEQHHSGQPPVRDIFPAPYHPRSRVFKLARQQNESEEDEFDMEEVCQLLDESSGIRAQEMGTPRRRERLTNLTPEEKMDRRKHKNRIAAQAARDRKKVNTHRLEESLRRALLEIRRLRGEVNMLRAENTRLEADNQTIRFEQGKPEPVNSPFQQNEIVLYEQHPLPSYHCMQQQQPKNSAIEMKPFIPRTQPQEQQQRIVAQPQQQGAIGGTDQLCDSVGSAASFNEPLQRERESKQVSTVNCTTIISNSSGLNKAKWTTTKGMAMACVVKVLMALWAASAKTSNCRRSSTNCSRTLTFQSMWTASATKSLKRDLLKRLMRLEPAKLAQLSKSKHKVAMAACLRLMGSQCKARSRHKWSSTDRSNSSNASNNNNISESEEELTQLAVVPQLRQL